MFKDSSSRHLTGFTVPHKTTKKLSKSIIMKQHFFIIVVVKFSGCLFIHLNSAWIKFIQRNTSNYTIVKKSYTFHQNSEVIEKLKFLNCLFVGLLVYNIMPTFIIYSTDF